MSVKVRFAPSPTGKLHLGNIRAALVNWLFCCQQGGEFILRIDDTDRERSTKENEDLIKTDLNWLGIHWHDTFRQSERFDRYDAVVEKLKADGRLYPCYETSEELDMKRKIQLGRGQPPVYDRAALSLTADEIAAYEAEGRTPHWRFKLNVPSRIEWSDKIRGFVSFDMASVSDPILIRGDGSYLYTLPSVIDDIDYGITHIVRGEDHVTNSAVQVQIFEAIGGSAPEMAHFALLTGKGGEGLSKRYGAMSISEFRDDAGLEPMAIISLIARVGTSEPIEAFSSIDPLIEGFDFGKFGRATAKLDPDELEWLNTKILRMTPYADLKDRLEGIDEAFWNAIQPNINKLTDVKDWLSIINGPVTPVIEDADHIAKTLELLPAGELTGDSWGEWTGRVKAETGVKGKALFMPLRQALTGQNHGPDMGVLLPLIGRDRVTARLKGEAA
ncbi:glutamate--tRNA ligase [Kordiimonas sp. SCSIO 12610]|uniref:glutamate--tRNA ligase n=1 Tax=Kordiimonas sp. SCSIO 12610 TaxID=2829597 RepID=UPI002109F003|nr:glutamate--tRNA ligase [Kordiimonas sp. SCSIO 12610]UTW54136.1 glutamate--tRNA ligase [Kordiimonas sp. SCSIO 12610]